MVNVLRAPRSRSSGQRCLQQRRGEAKAGGEQRSQPAREPAGLARPCMTWEHRKPSGSSVRAGSGRPCLGNAANHTPPSQSGGFSHLGALIGPEVSKDADSRLTSRDGVPWSRLGTQRITAVQTDNASRLQSPSRRAKRFPLL